MNKFAREILIIFVLLVQLGCNNEKKPDRPIEVEVISIDAKSGSQSELSEQIQLVKALKLETTEESLIGNIDKIVVLDDRVYILDRFVAKALFVFDTTGTFLFKMGKVGKGPGEFLSPNDFSVGKDGIKVLCNATYRILEWNKSGDYISEERIPYRVLNFHQYPKDIIFFENEPSSDFAVWIAKRGKLTDKFMERERADASLPIYPEAGGFKSNNALVTIRPYLSTNIFEIRDGFFQPLFFLDFIGNLKKELENEAIENGATANLRYNLSDEFLVLNFLHKGKTYITLYNLESKIALTSINNRVSGSGYFYTSVFLNTVVGVTMDGLFVSFVPFGGVKNLPNMVKGLDKKHLEALQPLLQYSSDAKPDDNPILVFLKPSTKI